MLAAGTVDSPVASAASTGTWEAGAGVGVGVATAVAGNVFSGAAAEAMPGAVARGGPKPIHAASASTVAPSNSTAMSRPRGGVAVAVAALSGAAPVSDAARAFGRGDAPPSACRADGPVAAKAGNFAVHPMQNIARSRFAVWQLAQRTVMVTRRQPIRPARGTPGTTGR